MVRVVSLTAEPTLSLSSGSAPMTESVAGAIAMPMPKPSTSRCAATMP